MRILAITLASLPLWACGGTIDLGSPPSDDGGGSKADTGSSDGGSPEANLPDVVPPSAFCQGSAPRMQINGADVPILSVTHKPVYMNCCDSEELVVGTGAFQSYFYLLWRASAGPSATETFDLGAPPANFGIELDLACDPLVSSCATPGLAEERYADGFSGTIVYSRAPAPNGTTSYCVFGAESPSAPHTLIHSFALYVP